MHLKRRLAGCLTIVAGLAVWGAARTAPARPAFGAQQSVQEKKLDAAQAGPAIAAAAPQSQTVIRSESNVVRVDVVVQDKKGNYVHDLASKDFKVYEDGKEQSVTSFSRGVDATAGPHGAEARRYMVLFFDYAGMDLSDQAQAHMQAEKFIASTAAPNRVMAVINFDGALHIAQNFTTNVAKLQAAVHNIKLGGQIDSGNTGDDIGGLNPLGLAGAQADFGVPTVLYALRDIARRMATVPGRKTVIFFTAGFPLTPDAQSEVTATIDICNKANVAIYPLDVRGLVPSKIGALRPLHELPRLMAVRADAANHGQLVSASFTYSATPSAPAVAPVVAILEADPQRGGGGHGGGGGGGGGGGTGGGKGGGGGGTGGGKGGGGGTGGGRGGGGVGQPFGNTTFVGASAIVPAFPVSATTNQQVLYELAQGTGGFPILDTNDLLGGMQKIARELDEYYLVGYVPAVVNGSGACHTIKVKVEVKGTNVRSRSGYCDVKGPDVLAGKPEGAELEKRVAGAQPGKSAVTAQLPFFFTGVNTARVNVSMELPPGTLKFAKAKKDAPDELNVLAIAYRPDGSVGARFSDSVKLEGDEAKSLAKQPFDYQNSFDIASGTYNLKLVVSSGGDSFTTYEAPLVIASYDGKHFDMSPLAMSDKVGSVSQMANLDSLLLEDHKVLVVKGVEMIPSATNRFAHKEKTLGFYTEIYDPLLLTDKPPHLALVYNVFDTKTNQMVYTSKGLLLDQFVSKGNPVVPVAMRLPLDKIPPGSYRIEVKAADDQHQASPVRTATFEMQ